MIYAELVFGLLLMGFGVLSKYFVDYIFKEKLMESYVIYIKGDINDADYVYRKSEITLNELAIVRKMANAIINNKHSHNYPVDDEIVSIMDEYYENECTTPESYKKFQY